MSENVDGAAPWSYRTGEWYAVFGPQAAIVLPASHKDRVLALWSLVDDGGGFDEVLDALLASGLSSLPGFVLVGGSGGSSRTTRALLRGDGVVGTFLVGDDEINLDAGASHTWVEKSFEEVAALRIDLPAGGGVGTVDLPIETGLVRVGRLDQPAMAWSGAAAPAEAPDLDRLALVPDPEPVPLTPEPELPREVPAESPAASDPVAPVPVVPTAAAILEGAAEDPPTELLEVVPDDGPQAPGEFRDLVAAASGPASDDETPTGATPDPLSDPLSPLDDVPADAPDPSEAAPDGWVTPWGVGAPPEAPPGAPSIPAPPSTPPPALPPTPAPSMPPPPAPPPPVEAGVIDPPPLAIGSWEPLGSRAVPEPPATGLPLGLDHDGLTVAGPSEAGEATPTPAGPAPDTTPPGHAVATLLVSDGQSVVVDRAVLIGRAPEARRFASTEQPQLVTVPSRLHEISSTHIEVRPGTGADHGSAVVTDMGSTNGTVLVQPGLGPEDLKPGIAVQLIPGAIINLGDGVTIQVSRA